MCAAGLGRDAVRCESVAVEWRKSGSHSVARRKTFVDAIARFCVSEKSGGATSFGLELRRDDTTGGRSTGTALLQFFDLSRGFSIHTRMIAEGKITVRQKSRGGGRTQCAQVMLSGCAVPQLREMLDVFARFMRRRTGATRPSSAAARSDRDKALRQLPNGRPTRGGSADRGRGRGAVQRGRGRGPRKRRPAGAVERAGGATPRPGPRHNHPATASAPSGAVNAAGARSTGAAARRRAKSPSAPHATRRRPENRVGSSRALVTSDENSAPPFKQRPPKATPPSKRRGQRRLAPSDPPFASVGAAGGAAAGVGRAMPKASAAASATAAAADSGSVSLSAEQLRVVTAAEEGRSVFFTGCAGSGKSLVLREIVRRLPPQSTFVTATTGIAACHVGGTTLAETTQETHLVPVITLSSLLCPPHALCRYHPPCLRRDLRQRRNAVG